MGGCQSPPRKCLACCVLHGFEFGAVPMAHFNLEIIDKVLSMKKIKQNLIDDYKCERFSDIFLNILLSYTNYINEYNWKKES